MYTEHFGLKMLPFENVPDPVFFFDQGEYHRVRQRVTESLRSGRGLIVITGPIGSGKTTLSQMIKSDFAQDIKIIWMAQPPENSSDLFLFIAQELGVVPASPASADFLPKTIRVFILKDIKDALQKMTSEGVRCLLIIDESHLLEDDVLEGIRILNNLEEGSTKLIQILLLGQEEFMETIKRPKMEPFKQRIATFEMLGKLNGDNIRKYVSHRIHVAGGQSSIFTDTGWEAIVLAFESGGAPRVINSLCDSALSTAFERKKTAADVHDVYEATKTLGIGKQLFHYIVALKNAERKQQEPVEPESSFKREPAVTDKKTDKRPEVFQPVKTLQSAEAINFSTNQKPLKMPILLLVSSIVVLVLSILFFCQRAESPDFVSCLMELIGF